MGTTYLQEEGKTEEQFIQNLEEPASDSRKSKARHHEWGDY
jgi:hypothetical protein